jgi:TolB protein
MPRKRPGASRVLRGRGAARRSSAPQDNSSMARFSAIAVSSLFIFLGLTATLNAQKGPRIAFARDSGIWVSDLQGASPRKIADGMDPSISPSGEKVAFTFLGKDDERYIAVGDISARTKTLFKKVPSGNSFGPVWSPDGAVLLFKVFISNVWRFGLINADGTGFRFLDKTGKSDLWSPCWAPDGQSIFCQDLSTIYRVNLEGKVLSKWDISNIIPNASMKWLANECFRGRTSPFDRSRYGRRY